MSHRVVLVTGASRGIGRAIALTFGRAHFDAVAAATTIEGNPEFADAMHGSGFEPMAVNLDLRSRVDQRGFARVLNSKSRIDVLVNNAGITRDGLAVRMKAGNWDAVLRTNLDGVRLHPAGTARHDAQ